jgi:hypothetical protein
MAGKPILKIFVQCSVCDEYIPLTVKTLTVPKHRDQYSPNTLCSGSDKPIKKVFRRPA